MTPGVHLEMSDPFCAGISECFTCPTRSESRRPSARLEEDSPRSCPSSKIVGTSLHPCSACYFAGQIVKFQALLQSLDSFLLSLHPKREGRSPKVLLQEHLNQRCHERGLISKAFNCTYVGKDVVVVDLLSSGGSRTKGS